MQKVLILFSLLFLVSNNSLWGQKWENGYIITSEGERIEGQLPKIDWVGYISFIEFRPNGVTEVNTYDPEALTEFGFDDRRFITAEVTFNDDSRTSTKLSGSKIPNYASDYAFLEVFFSGPVVLYRYISAKTYPHFYLSTESGPITYLEYHRYKGTSGERSVVKENNGFRSQLIQVLNNCPDLFATVSEMSYTFKEIWNGINQWYNCKGITSYQFPKGNNQSTINIGVLGGFTATKLREIGFDYEVLNPLEFSLNPTIGASILFAPPSRYQKISLGLDVQLISYSAEEEEVNRLNSAVSNFINTELEQTVLAFQLYFRYRFNSRKLPLFLEAGAMQAPELSFNYKEVLTQQLTMSSTVVENEITDTQSGEFGYWGGVGYEFGRLHIIARAFTGGRDLGDEESLFRFSLLGRYSIFN